MNILLVEDEDAIAAPLAEGLRREGFDVERVATGTAALAAALPDLVLLDLRLPDMDGTEVCQRLRARSDVPIIVVTAKGEEVDRVVGLELGADDYVVKPFGFRELLARIRAVLRRTQRGPSSYRLVAGSLEIDLRARRVVLGGREVELTTEGVRPPRTARLRSRRRRESRAPAPRGVEDGLVRADENRRRPRRLAAQEAW